ncbi:MAG: flagellar assembly protein FliH [Gallionella sp.]
MSDKRIAKEQMTAYQRWELSSFDQFGTAAQKGKASFSPSADAKLEQQRAHDEGYQTGHSTGYATGHEAGYAIGIQQAKTEAAQIGALLQNLQDALNQTDQEIAQSLLDLSLSVANKMVIEALQVKPEIILEIIREAISILPQFNQNAHLVLHPEDAELVRKHMNDDLIHAGWKIFTDPKVERGGCLVKTANSLIEATTEARWKRILDSIGQDHSWLA